MKDLNKMEFMVRDFSRIARYCRPIPFHVNNVKLTSVVDTEISCTVCGGSGQAITNFGPKGVWRMYCPNCKGTGKMKSRTSEENYQIKRANS